MLRGDDLHPDRPYWGMPRFLRWVALALVLGCPEPELDEVAEQCRPICDVLVDDCAVAAYPDHDSCMGGCAYVASQGGDLEGYGGCVDAAQCDTFELIDCEHSHGID